jgi:predicted AAA+ superfamily ATPase
LQVWTSILARMIQRRLLADLRNALAESPAVVLLGPRQVGKTTLALELTRELGGIYLDLESDRDRAKLTEPELFLADHPNDLLILDEIHRAPGLLPLLRGAIDRGRQDGGKTGGRFLMLGSASLDLLKQAGETLAGRVSFLELRPLDVVETASAGPGPESLWTRGGFPRSTLADDDRASLRWRKDFIRSYLERDIPQFGPRIPAETLRRFWTMLAHQQGTLLNLASRALLARIEDAFDGVLDGGSRGLGVSGKTAATYLDLMVDLLLVRRLPPWHANVGKRLVKSPKVYVRDSGIAHALLDVADRDALLGHPVVGRSYEGFVIETVLGCARPEAQGFFYRTSGGAEIDLLLVWPGERCWAIEVKHSLSPMVRRGFHAGCADLGPVRKLLVYPGTERFRLAADIEAVPLGELAAELTGIAAG